MLKLVHKYLHYCVGCFHIVGCELETQLIYYMLGFCAGKCDDGLLTVTALG